MARSHLLFLLTPLVVLSGCARYHDQVTELTIDDHEEVIRHLEELLARRGVQTPPPPALGQGGPVILIEGPANPPIGTIASYRVTVNNPSNQPATEARVAIAVPEGLEFVERPTGMAAPGPGAPLEWDAGPLAPGESKVLELALAVKSIGPFDVCAQARGSWVHCTRTTPVEPGLSCGLEAPPQVIVGRPFEIVTILANPGTGPTEAVEARLDTGTLGRVGGGEAGEIWRIARLAPGEVQRRSWTFAASAPGAYRIAFLAGSASGLSRECGAALDALAGALEITKTGPAARYTGQEAEFTILVTNPGTALITGVQVFDDHPRGFAFVRASGTGAYDPAGRRTFWDLGDLAVGDSRTLAVALSPEEEGEFENVVRASCREGLSDEARSPIRVLAAAGLGVQLGDSSDPARVGDQVTYDVVVTNQGRKTVSGVEMRVQIPDEATFVSAEGATAFRYDEAARSVVFDPVASFSPAARLRYSVRVRVDRAGDALARAFLRWNEFSKTVESQEGTTFYE